MTDKELDEGYRVPIRWHFPSGVQSRYATNLVVQHTEHEFVISFFEVYPPVILGDPEERKNALEQVEAVPAICVSRVIVAPGRLAEFIQVLQDNLDVYLSKTKSE